MPVEINGTEYKFNVVENGELVQHDAQLGDGTVLSSADSGETIPDGQNLFAHWDFSQANASDGEAYTSVADLSGNGHDLTGEGATHAADGINGLPAAHFDGTDDYLSGPAAGTLDIGSDDAAKSIYLTWRSLDASHTGYLITQTRNGSRSLQEFSHIFYGGRDKVDFSIGGTVSENPDLLDTNPHTTAALMDRPSGVATVSWDGSMQSTSTGDETNTTDRLIRVGARGEAVQGSNDVITATFFHGYVGEILIYDGQHDATTHDAVMDHLSRWSE